MIRQELRYMNSFHEVHTTVTWTNSVQGMCINVQLFSFRKNWLRHSITTALSPQLYLQKKPPQSEVLATKQKQDGQIHDNESTVLAIVLRQILSDSTASVSSYMKRRKQYYLERPSNMVRKNLCLHQRVTIPRMYSQPWMCLDLPGETRINWSAEA